MVTSVAYLVSFNHMKNQNGETLKKKKEASQSQRQRIHISFYFYLHRMRTFMRSISSGIRALEISAHQNEQILVSNRTLSSHTHTLFGRLKCKTCALQHI